MKQEPDIVAASLLKTATVTIRDVWCQGRHAHQSAEEWTTATHLVFPYRGVFIRHLGGDQAVAEANQVLFFNAAESYRVSHPVPGGDASLDLVISDPVLSEVAPHGLLRGGATAAFRQQRLRIDARAQVLVALLRHRLRNGIAEPLEAESLALTLARRALGPRTAHAPGASVGRQRLADRAKLGTHERSSAALDTGGDCSRSGSFPRVPHTGIPASGRAAALSLSAPVPTRTGAGAASSI